VHPQLASEIALGEDQGERGLVISASKDIEPGARAMLLLAEGLFRLDVLVTGDSLQTFVRNLAGGELRLQPEAGGSDGVVALGDVARLVPGRADLGFTLGEGADRVMTKVTIGTLRFADRGTIRVSAQAIVRRG
jgi:hypothetical protein